VFLAKYEFSLLPSNKVGPHIFSYTLISFLGQLLDEGVVKKRLGPISQKLLLLVDRKKVVVDDIILSLTLECLEQLGKKGGDFGVFILFVLSKNVVFLEMRVYMSANFFTSFLPAFCNILDGNENEGVIEKACAAFVSIMGEEGNGIDVSKDVQKEIVLALLNILKKKFGVRAKAAVLTALKVAAVHDLGILIRIF